MDPPSLPPIPGKDGPGQVEGRGPQGGAFLPWSDPGAANGAVHNVDGLGDEPVGYRVATPVSAY